MKKGKRGLSEIIVSLIVLLLVLVAIGIIWVVVKNILVSSSEKVTIDSLTNNIKIDEARVALEGGIPTANVKVTRTSGNANMTSMKFIFSDGTKIYEYEQKTNLPQTLETKTYPIEIPASKGITPTSVTVIPIFGKQNGLENKKDITLAPECTTTSDCPIGKICYNQKCLSNLILDGSFNTGAPWIFTVTCAYDSTNKRAFCTPALGSFRQTFGIIPGHTYQLTYTLTSSGVGTPITPTLGGKTGTIRTASGTYTENLVASSTGDLIFNANGVGANIYIDDISVYEIVSG